MTDNLPDIEGGAGRIVETTPVFAIGESGAPSISALDHALTVIADTYSIDVSYKPKVLTKFGRISNLGVSFQTVQSHGGTETMLTTNSIDTISSSNAGDTQAVKIEGHTIDGSGNLTFVSQTATLNGQNKVTLTTPLARSTRLYNDDSTDFAGDIYVYEDGNITAGVPDTAGDIHLVALVADDANQSLKCATSVSQYDYWVITKCFGAINEKTTAAVDFELQVRLKGKVWRTILPFSTSTNGGPAVFILDPPIIVPANSDVRLRARASTTNVEVNAWINGYLAIDGNAP